jgi:hypothetical protein
MVYLICIIVKRGFGIMHKTLNKSLGLIYLFLEYCISKYNIQGFFLPKFQLFFLQKRKIIIRKERGLGQN